jgi:hypothetical protein
MDVVISDNNYNQYYPAPAPQFITVSGRGVTSDTTRPTMRLSPDPAKVGLGVTMVVTVTDTSASSTVPTGEVTVTDTVGGTTTTLNRGAPIPLIGGKATLTTVPTVAGTHTIFARYHGADNRFLGSTFETTLTVQP